MQLVNAYTKARPWCKFNLIPFNPFAGSGLQSSGPERTQSFARILNAAGITTTVRKTRGGDIDAACGQLAGDIRDRTRIQQRMQRLHRQPFMQSPVQRFSTLESET